MLTEIRTLLLFESTRPQVAQNYSKDRNISKPCNPLQAQLNSFNKMWRGNGRILFTFRLGAAPNLRLDPMIRGLVFIWTQLGARTRTHTMGCYSFSHRAIFPHPFACRLMSTHTHRECKNQSKGALVRSANWSADAKANKHQTSRMLKISLYKWERSLALAASQSKSWGVRERACAKRGPSASTKSSSICVWHSRSTNLITHVNHAANRGSSTPGRRYYRNAANRPQGVLGCWGHSFVSRTRESLWNDNILDMENGNHVNTSLSAFPGKKQTANWLQSGMLMLAAMWWCYPHTTFTFDTRLFITARRMRMKLQIAIIASQKVIFFIQLTFQIIVLRALAWLRFGSFFPWGTHYRY